MRLHLIRPILLLFFFTLPCLAAEVRIRVTNAQAAPLKDALVIVQSLETEHDDELFRALTDGNGIIAAHDLPAGLYRAISTYPYSHWGTAVREFLVQSTPVNVQLRMEERGSTDQTPISIGQLSLHVLDKSGRPAASARVLVRDENADPQSEHWGTTNAQGNVTLQLTLNPAVLVVVYGDRLYTFAANGLDTQRTLHLE